MNSTPCGQYRRMSIAAKKHMKIASIYPPLPRESQSGMYLPARQNPRKGLEPLLS